MILFDDFLLKERVGGEAIDVANRKEVLRVREKFDNIQYHLVKF
jgi:hypothetical protein